MLVRTDDEVYRVDAVWLGPPRATFPWRARYVSYGVGLLVMMAIMFVQRRLGIPLDFFSVAWALVGTVALTRLLGKKITYDRPFGQVVSQFWAEVTGPRARTGLGGGAVRVDHVKVRPQRGRGGGSRSAPRRTPVAAEASRGAEPAARRTEPVAPARTGARAEPVRTAPEAWAPRRTRPAEPAGARARAGKGARRGRS